MWKGNDFLPGGSSQRPADILPVLPSSLGRWPNAPLFIASAQATSFDLTIFIVVAPRVRNVRASILRAGGGGGLDPGEQARQLVGRKRRRAEWHLELERRIV